jgi:hypothetical protein
LQFALHHLSNFQTIVKAPFRLKYKVEKSVGFDNRSIISDTVVDGLQLATECEEKDS